MKLRTEFHYLAPDSERYACIDVDEYDGAPDGGGLVGYGDTEEAAKQDFMDQWLERESERDCARAVKQVNYWDAFFGKLLGIKP